MKFFVYNFKKKEKQSNLFNFFHKMEKYEKNSTRTKNKAVKVFTEHRETDDGLKKQYKYLMKNIFI